MVEKNELAKIVGEVNVIDDPDVIESYAGDLSFNSRTPPSFIVRPKDTAQVESLVKWANESMTPLVPVSSGPPHFKGDTIPAVGNAVVLDFSSMKQIMRIDRRNRAAMIEPGVTFNQLKEALAQDGMRPFMPLLPRSTKSVLACYLEREPIISPRHHWDIGDPMLCSEVVFGCGELFRTGSAAGPGSLEDQRKVGQAQKYPAGPSQASLHRIIQGSQGTIGCVTWITLKTQLIPALQKPLLVGSNDLRQLHELAHWAIRLRLVDECFIVNDLNLAAIYANRNNADYRSLKHGLFPFILVLNLAGYDYFPDERIDWQYDYLLKNAQRIGVKTAASLGNISAELLMLQLQSCSNNPYWKLNMKGSFHDIFFLTGRDRLQSQIDTLLRIAFDHGFASEDIGIYIQPIVQGTSWHCEFNIYFDPNNSERSEAVRRISREGAIKLMEIGAFFSRPYGEWVDPAYRRDSETTATLRKVKTIFDKNNILNPGKLCY